MTGFTINGIRLTKRDGANLAAIITNNTESFMTTVAVLSFTWVTWFWVIIRLHYSVAQSAYGEWGPCAVQLAWKKHGTSFELWRTPMQQKLHSLMYGEGIFWCYIRGFHGRIISACRQPHPGLCQWPFFLHKDINTEYIKEERLQYLKNLLPMRFR